MAEKIVTESVLKQSTEDILKAVVEHLYDFEEYSDESISNLFSLTPEEVQQISEIINDEVISKYKLWSSQGTSNKINEAKIECNNYANSLIGNISSIQLEWCETSLPTVGETNKIYILPVTNEGVTVNTLNIWNSETSSYISIGNLEINLSDYVDKTTYDSDMALKANKTEVVSQDDLLTTTENATTSNVLSAKTTIDELDKKVDKTSISNTIDKYSTDNTIPTSKAVNDRVANLKTSVEISYADYLALSDEEKNNGVAYYIPDLPVSTSGEIIGDVEYGVFVNDVDTVPLVGGIIPISTKLQGNIEYNNGYVLKKGKTYNINVVVDGYTASDTTNAHIRYSLNFGSNTLIEGIAIPSGSTSKWGTSQVSFVYTPTEDGVLTVKCGSIQNIAGLITGFSKVTITEIPSYKGLIDVSDEHIKDIADKLLYGGDLQHKADLNDVSELTKERQWSVCYYTTTDANTPKTGTYGIVISYTSKYTDDYNQWAIDNKGVVWFRRALVTTSGGADSLATATWTTKDSTIDDIPWTTLTLDSSKFSSDGTTNIGYMVKNGFCTIVVSGIQVVSTGESIVVDSGFPIPACGNNYASNILQVSASSTVPTKPVYLIAKNDTLKILTNESTGTNLWGSLTYPVAES